MKKEKGAHAQVFCFNYLYTSNYQEVLKKKKKKDPKGFCSRARIYFMTQQVEENMSQSLEEPGGPVKGEKAYHPSPQHKDRRLRKSPDPCMPYPGSPRHPTRIDSFLQTVVKFVRSVINTMSTRRPSTDMLRPTMYMHAHTEN